jgi:hypothetical protein
MLTNGSTLSYNSAHRLTQGRVSLPRIAVRLFISAVSIAKAFFTAQMSSLQLLACDTNFYEHYTDVLPQIGLTGESTSTTPVSKWMDWTLPAAPKDIALQSVRIGLHYFT